MAYLNITEELNTHGKRLPVGHVLIFDYEGSPVYLKIMRKAKGQVYAKRLDPDLFLTPEQADEQIVIKKR
jgi:hypothetical protein